MNYLISPDRKSLTITVDDEERVKLAIEYSTCPESELPSCDSDESMYDYFDKLVANSELDWVNPADTGDLTDAPMLGIHEYNESGTERKVLERWAFMQYEVKSLLAQLRDFGKAVLIA